MIKIIKEGKNPKILVLTPLLKNDTVSHQISRETKISIKRNNIDYIWASYEGPYKHARNCQEGLHTFYKTFHYLPKYIFILDRDIIAGRNMLDKLYNCLSKTSEKVAYSYCPFEYKGYINVKIPPVIWNIFDLKKRNYISSNSLYKTDALEKIGGFVIDEDTHRLSDWCFFLKAARMGYKGILCSNTSFVAVSTENDISAGGQREYNDTKKLVVERYISKFGE